MRASIGLAAAALMLASCGLPAPSPMEVSAPEPGPAPSAPGPPETPTYDPASATALLLVRATARGPLPRMRPIKFDADPKCGEQHKQVVIEETIVATDGRLANVIAWVSKGGDRWVHPVPVVPAAVESKGCMFIPHVLTLQTGQAVQFSNRDPVQICPHGLPKVNGEFHKVLPKGGSPVSLTFPREEVAILVRDDCYGWMRCWLGVFAHPFHGITDREGTVALKVPPGEYEVSSWHEYPKFAAPAPRTVTVADGETKEIEFVFEVPAK